MKFELVSALRVVYVFCNFRKNVKLLDPILDLYHDSLPRTGFQGIYLYFSNLVQHFFNLTRSLQRVAL